MMLGHRENSPVTGLEGKYSIRFVTGSLPFLFSPPLTLLYPSQYRRTTRPGPSRVMAGTAKPEPRAISWQGLLCD